MKKTMLLNIKGRKASLAVIKAYEKAFGIPKGYKVHSLTVVFEKSE